MLWVKPSPSGAWQLRGREGEILRKDIRFQISELRIQNSEFRHFPGCQGGIGGKDRVRQAISGLVPLRAEGKLGAEIEGIEGEGIGW